MEEVNVTQSMYKCQFCGTLYDSKEKALKCEDIYRQVKELEDLKEPYCWFNLNYQDNQEDHYVFSHKVYVSKPKDKSCLHSEACIYSSLWNDYYTIGKSWRWRVKEILSIENAYDKLGIIPIIRELLSEYLPNDVKERIQKVYDRHNEFLLKSIKEMSPEKMVDYIYNIRKIPEVYKDSFYNKDCDYVEQYFQLSDLSKVKIS